MALWIAAACECLLVVVAGTSAVAVAAATLVTASATAIALWGLGTRPRTMAARGRGELWEAPDSAVELSVITPTFNGEAAVPTCLDDIATALGEAGVSHEVILVSDGSTDRTLDAARPYESRGVRVLHYERNRGKGYALRAGLARATGLYVAFIDSDGDLDPRDLVKFLALVRLYDADVVLGSKRHPMSQVEYPPARRLMSWVYHKLVRLTFGLRVRDTQTGVKLIRREALAEVLPRLQEDRFALDLELLVALRQARYRRILEAPVTIRYRFTSTVSWRSVLGIIRDTTAIWCRCYLRGDYEPAQRDARSDPAPYVFPVTTAAEA
jgi:glycosyltransferase involved in cell wall biosynthesis